MDWAALLLILAGLVNLYLWQRDRDRERTERERRSEGL